MMSLTHCYQKKSGRSFTVMPQNSHDGKRESLTSRDLRYRRFYRQVFLLAADSHR